MKWCQILLALIAISNVLNMSQINPKPGEKCFYYDSQNFEFKLGACTPGYFCKFGSGTNITNATGTCEKALSLVGMRCTDFSQCYTGNCDSNTTRCAEKEDGRCQSHEECEVGKYCKDGRCHSVKNKGENCNEDYECSFGCFCKEGKCKTFQEIKKGEPAEDKNFIQELKEGKFLGSGDKKLCESYSIATAYRENRSICAETDYENSVEKEDLFTNCTEDEDCQLKIIVDNTTTKFGYGKCILNIFSKNFSNPDKYCSLPSTNQRVANLMEATTDIKGILEINTRHWAFILEKLGIFAETLINLNLFYNYSQANPAFTGYPSYFIEFFEQLEDAVDVERQPKSYCSEGQYLKNGTCHACKGFCKKCTSEENCEECYPRFYKIDEKKCAPCQEHCKSCNSSKCAICETGYFLDPTDTYCEPCKVQNCKECSQTQCRTCDDGFAKIDNRCEEKCKKENCKVCDDDATSCDICMEGFFLSGAECEKCDDNCATCATNRNLCTSCKEGFSLNDENQCVGCPEGCIQCEKDEDKGEEMKCTKCKNSFSLNEGKCTQCNLLNCADCKNDPSKCEACAEGYLLENKEYCRQCQTGCKTCIAGGICVDCFEGYYLDIKNGTYSCKREAKCKKGQYKSEGECHWCSKFCLDCSNSTVCYECSNPFFLSKGECKICPDHCAKCVEEEKDKGVPKCLECSPGYYADKGACSICQVRKCKVCTDQSTCTECEFGYVLINGECVVQKCSDQFCQQCLYDVNICEECLEGYYLETDGKCRSCAEGCKKCKEPKTCYECKDGYYFDYKTEKCQKKLDCGEGKYESNGTCASCSPNCIKCSSESVCGECKEQYYITGDNKCQACPTNCEICNDKNGICAKCFTGYYKVDGGTKCEKCNIENCEDCTSPNYCIICKDGLYQVEGICSETCEVIGCYDCNVNKNMCEQCHSEYYINENKTNCENCTHDDNGCYQCINSTNCTSCLDGFEFDEENKKCWSSSGYLAVGFLLLLVFAFL